MCPWDATTDAATADAEADTGSGSAVLCRACRHRLTRKGLGTRAAGAHEHAYLNPAGIVYRFACYADAPGAHALGASSREWSWFPGHAWRVAICGGCAVHVGWRFQADAGGGFYGLIVDRIVEEE